jgi:N-acyl-L-homoserine lactone synthetase
MFITVEAHQYAQYADVLDRMYRLRKRVFVDELGWEVPVEDGLERDAYDGFGPAYLIWMNPETRAVYGSMRLMPTTGPTLLYNVFRDTFPEAAALSAPGIWEATRTCVDAEAIAADMRGITVNRAMGLLCLATGECALAHGIHTVVCNYEPHMKRVYAGFGAKLQELGRADGFGKRPVCCGLFSISESFVTGMRAALGHSEPLYRHRANAVPQRRDLAA